MSYFSEPLKLLIENSSKDRSNYKPGSCGPVLFLGSFFVKSHIILYASEPASLAGHFHSSLKHLLGTCIFLGMLGCASCSKQ